RGQRHQRYSLVRDLAKTPERHMLFVTATPHSGNDDAFQILVSFLDQDITLVDDDLAKDEYQRQRERLARHLVQRRRADIVSYLDETDFPNREVREAHYDLSAAQRALLEQIFEYGRSKVGDRAQGNEQKWRMRWWSILGIMRALSSSPAAALATLETRSELAAAYEPE